MSEVPRTCRQTATPRSVRARLNRYVHGLAMRNRADDLLVEHDLPLYRTIHQAFLAR